VQIFLASTEAQHVVNSLWRGDWIQKNNAKDDIDYVQYEPAEEGGFWAHLDPERISVPRYQATFRVLVWLFFLFGEPRASRGGQSRPTDDQCTLKPCRGEL
jgi:hypothetical protein